MAAQVAELAGLTAGRLPIVGRVNRRRARGWLLWAVGAASALGVGAWWWSAADQAPARAEARPEGVGETAPSVAPPRSLGRAVPLSDAAPSPDGGTSPIEVISAEDGQPIAGAVVSVWDPASRRGHHHWRIPEAFRAETNGAGRVEVPPQSKEDLRLTVQRDFFFLYTGPFVPGTQVALEPIPALHGRVLSPARAPVAGALVTAVHVPEQHTVTAVDGTFALRLKRVDRLLAEKDGAVALSPAVDETQPLPPGPLELVLAVPSPKAGRVVGRDGQPLAGVTVTTSVQAVNWRQETGPDGVFRVPELSGVWVALRCEKPGFVPISLAGLPPREADIVLSRPARLEGRLLDQQGRALGGELVTLSGVDVAFASQEATTDAEGRFTFGDLDEPAVQLQALTRDEQMTELRVALREGETTRVTLALRPELELVPLELVSTQGIAVEGCDTTAVPVPAAGWSSTSDFTGESIELRRGRYQFSVRCDDGRGADETRDVSPPTPVRIIVSSDAGQVFDDERPAEVVLVLAVTPDGRPVEGARVGCHTASGLTGPDGRFRCEVRANDQVWPLHVHVMKEGARGLARATGKEPEVRVVLRELVTLRGRIDGALPSGTLTVFTRSAGGDAEVPLVGNSFAVEGRPAIRTFVCVHRRPGPGPDVERLGCAISETGEEVVIRLGAPGKVSFTALDRAGAPLPDPIIYVDRVSHLADAPTGAATLELPPGDHVLILNVEGSRARHEARFTVRPGEVTNLGGLRLE